MTSRISRLDFAELAPGVAAALRPKYERLGYLGEFFAATAHQPAALAAFIEFTESAKGELDMRLVELVALSVAALKQVAYERNQHERLSVRLGYGRDWVAAVERLDPENEPALDAVERTVQRFVIDAIRLDGRDASDALDAVVAQIGVPQAVAVLMVLGRYVAHALMVNCLDIGPPVPSIFEDGFGG